jgi:CheY-like chemotaxis protein
MSYVRDASESAERLIGLVNDLLDASRLESGSLKMKPQPTGLVELTQSVLDEVTTLVRARGHRLSVEGAETAPRVLADPQLLRQVILNLTSNAIKYTPAGGAVMVRIGRENGLARWAISDTGVGIPGAAQARLFEKFFRAENAATIETEGTGLGLYLVRTGLVRIRGRSGLDLPLHAAPQRVRLMSDTAKRLLLVEDDRFLRRACEVSLKQRGFAVTSAVDGEEGLRLARSERPDLILLDMLMPKLSGLDVLKALRSDPTTRGLRVLVLSNSSREQDVQEVTRLGIEGYLVKSNLSLQSLGDEVSRILGLAG